MVTDFFKFTKRTIKTEKSETATTSTKMPQDVLQSQQYDFDKSSVPSDDDIEIIDVILPKEPPENPFIPCSPDIVEIVKEERSSPHRDDNSEVKLKNPELNSPEPSASTKMPEEPSASTKKNQVLPPKCLKNQVLPPNA